MSRVALLLAALTLTGCLAAPPPEADSPTAALAPCPKEDPGDRVTLYGRISGTDGSPLGATEVRAVSQTGGGSATVITDDSGCYRMVLHAARSIRADGSHIYTLTAHVLDYRDEKAVAENVTRGEIREVNLIMSRL